MLTAADDLFHQPVFGDYTWTEERWFSFMIPEENRLGWIYMVFRPNLGVVMSEVTIWSKLCKDYSESDYWDKQAHVPMPAANLDNIVLPSGISLRVLEPLKRYRVDYDGGRGTELHLEFEGLMRPIESAEVRVQAQEGYGEAMVNQAGFGGVSNHFDQMVMVTGEMILDGQRHQVSHPTTRDGAWGPRPEGKYPPLSFDTGHFGTGLSFYLLNSLTSGSAGQAMEGYIFEDGEAHPLASGTAEYHPDCHSVRRIVYRLTDRRGKRFVFEGEPTALIPAYPHFPSEYCHAMLVRYQFDGRTGWGDTALCWSIAQIQAERRAAARRAEARFSP